MSWRETAGNYNLPILFSCQCKNMNIKIFLGFLSGYMSYVNIFTMSRTEITTVIIIV